MITAKDIMNRELITVTKQTPIQEAITLLVKHRITGLPVVSANMKVEGILSELDLLRLYQHEDMGSKTVADFMSPKAVGFDENTDLGEICVCLVQKGIRRVPILSNGKLVGIVSRRDIINHIYEVKVTDKKNVEQVKISLAEALSRIEKSVDDMASDFVDF